MSRMIRLLMGVSVVAAFVGSLVSSASAVEFTLTVSCTESTGIATLCDATIENGTTLTELSGEEEVLCRIDPGTTFDFLISTLGLVILSKKLTCLNTFAMQLAPLFTTPTLVGVWDFEEAVIDEPSTCKLKNETITTNSLTAKTGTNANELVFEPTTAGGSFTTLEIEGASCPATIVGSTTFKGTQ